MGSLLEPQRHCWRWSSGCRQQHQARPAPGSRGSRKLRITTSVKVSWSVEDRVWLSPEVHHRGPPHLPPMDALSGCIGPLSTLPPNPGLSQKGGAQPRAQWQLRLLLQTCSGKEKRRVPQDQGLPRSPHTHLSGHSPRDHGRRSGRAPALGR